MEQAKFKVRRRFERLLKKLPTTGERASDLDITGIVGIPSSDSYIKCLKDFLETPPKINMFLLGQSGENYSRDIKAYLNEEIVKYIDRLAQLEQSPVAIRIHLEDLQRKLKSLVNYLEKTPEPVITGGSKDPLFSNAQRMRKQDEDFIRQMEEQIAKYSTMLVSLPQLKFRPQSSTSKK